MYSFPVQARSIFSPALQHAPGLHSLSFGSQASHECALSLLGRFAPSLLSSLDMSSTNSVMFKLDVEALTPSCVKDYFGHDRGGGRMG